MKIGLIGKGAIARYVSSALASRGHEVGAILLRPERVTAGTALEFGSVGALPADLDLMIDCAGHAGLADHGPKILARGCDMITVSLGALADPDIEAALLQAAQDGGARLHLASGAIGALDCLNAARAGKLTSVTYTGRKPPRGWQGSPAEDKLDLDGMTEGAEIHFEGSARAAALEYPKNANVAAAVALAGLGFDATQVQLIADASITQNIHEITATGDFGHFHFQISGNSLPDNPRSSALAAMSVLGKLDQITRSITL
ncbi:aspartate dehydrogenase [Ruegeria sp.]|uniref:aspartate dehydrogenase n=1 Tax=Ruegeria sp. TaxID=1879320 RepID=UPI00230DFB5F|nr:aspartate dehydrogenase [Ruegeria sp.]MDA7965312.1 aspartate dehydrogenase [Ruegeria sp.]